MTVRSAFEQVMVVYMCVIYLQRLIGYIELVHAIQGPVPIVGFDRLKFLSVFDGYAGKKLVLASC